MFVRIVLIIGLLVSAYIAYVGLMSPDQLLAGAGILVEGADARNEVRAQYGGLYLVTGIVMFLCLIGRLPQKFGLGVLLVSVGGVLIGRVLSLMIEGPSVFSDYSTSIKVFYGFDIVITLLTVLALRQINRSDAPKIQE